MKPSVFLRTDRWCRCWKDGGYTEGCEAPGVFFFIPSKGGPRKQHLPRISISWRNSMKKPTWELQVDGDKPFFLWRTFADLVSSRPVLNREGLAETLGVFPAARKRDLQKATARFLNTLFWRPTGMQVCQSLGGGFVHVCTLSFQSK